MTYKKLFARNTRLLPAVTNFILILVACGRIDMTVALAKSSFYGIFDFVRLGQLVHDFLLAHTHADAH